MPSGVYIRSDEHKRKISEYNKTRVFTKETRDKIGLSSRGRVPFNKGKKGLQVAWNKGIPHTEEAKKKMSATKLINRNKKGVVVDHKKRQSIEYVHWRKECLLRDNFTCQKTRISGGLLNVHHINNFSEFPELMFNVDNGITLSQKAHIEFHKIYGKKHNTLEQILEFIESNNK